MQMGLGLELCSVALGVAGHEYLAGGFLLGGLMLVLASTFGPRLLKGKIQLTGMEFELAKEEEARAVTTTIASAPEEPIEVGLDEEEDATRSLLSDVLLERLFESHTWSDREDCRFQLYLYDPEAMMPANGASPRSCLHGRGLPGEKRPRLGLQPATLCLMGRSGG